MMKKAKKVFHVKKGGRSFIDNVAPLSFKEVEKPKDEIVYSESNIFHIDRKIKSILKSKTEELDEIKKEYKNKKLNREDKLDAVGVRASDAEILELKNKINDLSFSCDLGYYVFKSHRIIDDYKKLSLSNSRERSFTEIQMRNTKEENKFRRLKCLFSSLARKYVDVRQKDEINLWTETRGLKEDSSCSNCNGILMIEDLKEFVRYCSICNFVEKIFDNVPTYKDKDRINTHVKNKYSPREHFIKAMDQVQGKQGNRVPDEVFELLRDEIGKLNIPIEKICKETLKKFLHELNFPRYYKDIHLIHHKLTGVIQLDISHLVDELLRMFDIFVGKYSKLPISRTHSLNTFFLLFRFLGMRNVDCSRDDFFILKTDSKFREHNEIFDFVVSQFDDGF